MAGMGIQDGADLLAVLAADMQRGAEIGDMVEAGLALQLLGQVAHIGAFPAKGDKAGTVDDLAHRALDDLVAVGEIDDAVAALGLVHIMGGDQHGHALQGKLVDLVPEFPARLRIDPGGRLVEQ